MLSRLAQKFFGSKNDRDLKRMQPLVEEINQLEAALQKLSLEELRAQTDTFRSRIQEATRAARSQLMKVTQLALETEDREGREEFQEEGEELEKELHVAEAEVLDEILSHAYATVREVSRRVTGMRHFDSQLLGGIVLHQGKIAEMKTGEGKTLVATLSLYLNALLGRGSHLVTVNDYLARRDVQWMGPIYHTLGLSTGSIVHDTSFIFDPRHVVKDYRYMNLRAVTRKEAYGADITYGTNNEFGFDYLRDNMKFSLDDYVQRELQYSIVDEVDNILIDEARTPLIISGPAEESTEKYYNINRVIPRLQRESDYAIDEKLKAATLTEEGISKVERILGVRNLYDPTEIGTLHHVNQALKAYALFKRDIDYVIKDGEVMIVDEFTGRLMPGRRWSDGLHQAVEAKEGVRIREENQTLASITIQNYFRMYRKLGGMTGTADTEAVEFKKIYDLDVLVIPSNRPMVRLDFPDVVYKTEREKIDAVIEDILDCHGRGQPVLVGTISVEKSEHLGRMLKRKGVKHNVLNAVNHEAEANIIAQAGRFGAVTIATNMAGRGTDILLGGNPEFLARSEVEKRWVNKAGASRAQKGKKTEKSYEERLEEIRTEYNDAMAQAQEKYEPAWKPFEEERNGALKRMTETYRPYLLATLQKARADHGSAAAKLDSVDGGLSAEQMDTYSKTCEAYEQALSDYDKVIGPALDEEQQHEYEAARNDFLTVLTEDGSTVSTGAVSERFGLVRGRYERWLQNYCESIVQMAEYTLSDDGRVQEEYQQARRAYEDNQHAYEQADQRYEEERKPYQKAVAEAESLYEEKRREHVLVIEEVREQLEKTPDLYSQNFKEGLEKYERTCSEEREQVVAAGGVHILGTERHESRRIDNQLRGRSGRQGDAGSSRFYLSLEDDLLRIFGAERVQKIMDRMGMEEGEPIEHGLVSRAIENAQGRVEGHNFDIRKHLLEYDDVMNKQREVIYKQRRGFLAGENLKEEILEIVEGVVEQTAANHADPGLPDEEWDPKGLDDAVFRQFGFRLNLNEGQQAGLAAEELYDLVRERVLQQYEEREQAFTPPVMRYLEKVIMLQTMDNLWKDHLLAMDHLKEGIGLRGYAQKNPLQEYKKEGFVLFEELSDRMQDDVVEKLYTVQVAREEDVQRMEASAAPRRSLRMSHGDSMSLQSGPQRQQLLQPQPAQNVQAGPVSQAAQPALAIRDTPKVGRNAPCPCGSGKKYKKCHGA